MSWYFYWAFIVLFAHKLVRFRSHCNRCVVKYTKMPIISTQKTEALIWYCFWFLGGFHELQIWFQKQMITLKLIQFEYFHNASAALPSPVRLVLINMNFKRKWGNDMKLCRVILRKKDGSENHTLLRQNREKKKTPERIRLKIRIVTGPSITNTKKKCNRFSWSVKTYASPVKSGWTNRRGLRRFYQGIKITRNCISCVKSMLDKFVSYHLVSFISIIFEMIVKKLIVILWFERWSSFWLSYGLRFEKKCSVTC